MITHVQLYSMKRKMYNEYIIESQNTTEMIDVIRVEQLKDLPTEAKAIDLNDIRKKHINIVYYSKFDDEI